jgi:hypothetical protein
VPSNAREILKQWTDVHGLSIAPARRAKVDGYPREAWVSAAGEEIIESFAIDIGHGTPLATGSGDEQCGAAGAFLLDVGISSSYHIAKFFGLTRERVALARVDARTVISKERHAPERKELVSPARVDQSNAAQRDASEQIVHEGEILDRESEVEPEFSRRPRLPIDINAVITRALTAAGLMKR